MSFCHLLSTLCSQVVFHNVPHFSRGRQIAGQKVHRKIAGAVQNVKPLYFLSRSFEIREKRPNFRGLTFYPLALLRK